jgi:alpha-tubulin suppressor-like RCC1 family protein
MDEPRMISGLPNIRKTVCGDAHSVVLAECGEVYVFGFSYQGQLGLGLTGDCEVFQVFEPVKLELSGCIIVDVFAGSTFTFFKTSSGDVFSCGLNDCNQLGH